MLTGSSRKTNLEQPKKWDKFIQIFAKEEIKYKKGVAGEICELTYLRKCGNKNQEIRKHFLRNNRISIFIPSEWIKRLFFQSNLAM